MERVGAVPLQRPLGLVTRHCFLERAAIVTMPVVLLANILRVAQFRTLAIAFLWSESSRKGNILDRLLAVQDQPKQCAQHTLHLFRRYTLVYASLQILGTNVCELGREVVRETRSKHYNELRPKS